MLASPLAVPELTVQDLGCMGALCGSMAAGQGPNTTAQVRAHVEHSGGDTHRGANNNLIVPYLSSWFTDCPHVDLRDFEKRLINVPRKKRERAGLVFEPS